MQKISKYELVNIITLLRENLSNLKESRSCASSQNGCVNCKNHYARCPYDRFHEGIEDIERALNSVHDDESYPTILQIALQTLKDVQEQVRRMAPNAQPDGIR